MSTPISPGSHGPMAGRPLIPPKSAESGGGVHSQQGSKIPRTIGPPKQTTIDTQQQTIQTQAPTKTTPTKVSQLTDKDVFKAAAKFVDLNSFNKELALLMAAHGIEISEESFTLINKLLKGKKSKSAQESAILLISKGLGNQVENTDILSNILNKNLLISKSLNQLAQLQSKMMDILNSSLKNNPSLQAFIAVFDDFNEQLKKLRQLNKNNALLTNQNTLIDDLVTMEKFLNGLNSKLMINNKTMLKYIQELGQLNQHILGQIILNQNSVKQPLGLLESYHYFQLPNPLAAQTIVELLLRKQSKTHPNKKSSPSDDKKQEKIIISLDTETMGTLTVIVVVMGFKIWCSVYTDKESAVNHAVSFRQELSENLKKYQYTLEDFKSIRKKINIKKFIAPSQDISEVKRVETEI